MLSGRQTNIASQTWNCQIWRFPKCRCLGLHALPQQDLRTLRFTTLLSKLEQAVTSCVARALERRPPPQVSHLGTMGFLNLLDPNKSREFEIDRWTCFYLALNQWYQIDFPRFLSTIHKQIVLSSHRRRILRRAFDVQALANQLPMGRGRPVT